MSVDPPSPHSILFGEVADNQWVPPALVSPFASMESFIVPRPAEALACSHESPKEKPSALLPEEEARVYLLSAIRGAPKLPKSRHIGVLQCQEVHLDGADFLAAESSEKLLDSEESLDFQPYIQPSPREHRTRFFCLDHLDMKQCSVPVSSYLINAKVQVGIQWFDSAEAHVLARDAAEKRGPCNIVEAQCDEISGQMRIFSDTHVPVLQKASSIDDRNQAITRIESALNSNQDIATLEVADLIHILQFCRAKAFPQVWLKTLLEIQNEISMQLNIDSNSSESSPVNRKLNTTVSTPSSQLSQ